MLFSLISCCIVATVIAADENYRSGYLIIRENKYFADQVAKETNSPSPQTPAQPKTTFLSHASPITGYFPNSGKLTLIAR